MARAVRRLTASRVAAEIRPGYYADGGGLYLQVAKGGGRSWVFRYQRVGRRRELGLGSTTAVPLSLARKKAASLRRQLAEGTDPFVERRLAAAAANILAQQEACEAVSAPGPAVADDSPRVYTDDILDGIIEAGGGLRDGDLAPLKFGGAILRHRLSRRERLRQRLETAAQACLASVGQPTPAGVANALADIEAPARQLLAALRPRKGDARTNRLRGAIYAELATKAGNLFGRDRAGDTWLEEVVISLWMLHRCARVSERERRRAAGSSTWARPPEKERLRDLYGAILMAWIIDFEQRPTVTVAVDDHAVSGKMVAFFQAALRPLLPEVPSGDAIRKRVGRLMRGVSWRQIMDRAADNPL